MFKDSSLHSVIANESLANSMNPLLKLTKWLLVRQFSRTQSGRRRLGSVRTLARSRVRVRAGYKFVSCRRHGAYIPAF